MLLGMMDLPSRERGTCSNIFHITSCLTPPTFSVTRLFSCRDFWMMKGSGAWVSGNRGVALCGLSGSRKQKESVASVDRQLANS